jgi:thiol-disulfide isomerase/thioredoxin
VFIPKIEAGVAKVAGKLIDFPQKEDSLLSLSMTIAYPVTAELKTYTAQVEADDSFSFEIPLECNVITSIEINGLSSGICLAPNKDTFIELTYIADEHIKVNMKSSLGLTNEDMENLSSAALDILYSDNINWDIIDLLNKESVETLDSLQQYINRMSFLSDKAKSVMSHSYQLYMLKVLMEYTNTFNQYENGTTFDDYENSCYSFFRCIDLNDPIYLYGFYHEVTENIFTNKKFNIPPIGDTFVEDWLNTVETNIAGLLGIKKGLFFDLLVANAYAKQMNDETKPLSDIQKENIKKHFKNKSFVDILLRKSEKIKKVAGITSTLTTNETPFIRREALTAEQNDKLPQGELVDSIVSKYRGKIVVIDFWATWCAPCMQAMAESRELKQEMLNKDVVFVYITNRSSPRKLWEEKITGIGGEHYYLNGDEWESISFSDKYGFNGIPTYLIFDTNGKLRHKITAYPGSDAMRKMITELLN